MNPARLEMDVDPSPIFTAEEVRFFLKEDDDSIQDDILDLFVAMATQCGENCTNRSFVTQDWIQYFDSFDCALRLGRGKVQTVSAVKYLDANGDEQTLSAANYVTDLVSEPARIQLASGGTWPTIDDVPNAVRVEFSAGYGDEPANVPAELRLWLLRCVGYLNENRQAQDLPEHLISELFSFRIQL